MIHDTPFPKAYPSESEMMLTPQLFKVEDAGGISYKMAQRHLQDKRFKLQRSTYSDPFYEDFRESFNRDHFFGTLILLISSGTAVIFSSMFPTANNLDAHQPYVIEKVDRCTQRSEDPCNMPTGIGGFGIGYAAAALLIFGIFYTPYAKYYRTKENRAIDAREEKIALLQKQLIAVGPDKKPLYPQDAALFIEQLKDSEKWLFSAMNFNQLRCCRLQHPNLFAKYLKTPLFSVKQQRNWRLLERFELAQGSYRELKEILNWDGNIQLLRNNKQLYELTLKAIGLKTLEMHRKIFRLFHQILRESLLLKEVSCALAKEKTKQIILSVAGGDLSLQEAVEQELYPNEKVWIQSYCFSLPEYLARWLANRLTKVDEEKFVREFNEEEIDRYLQFLRGEKVPFEMWYPLLKIASFLGDTLSMGKLENSLSKQLPRLFESHDLHLILNDLSSYNLPLLTSSIDEYLAKTFEDEEFNQEILIDNFQLAAKYNLRAYSKKMNVFLQEKLEKTLNEIDSREIFLEKLALYNHLTAEPEIDESIHEGLEQHLKEWLLAHPKEIDALYYCAEEQNWSWLKEKIGKIIQQCPDLKNFTFIPNELIELVVIDY